MSVQQPTNTYYGTDPCPDEGGYSWCGINVPSRRSPKGLGAMSDSGAATFDGDPEHGATSGTRMHSDPVTFPDATRAKILAARDALDEALDEPFYQAGLPNWALAIIGAAHRYRDERREARREAGR